MSIRSIDWNAMWKEDTDRSHWKDEMSSRELWDKRAASFGNRINRVKDGESLDKDDYISKMIARIEVEPGWTVLDIGCGPGTLAIPLALKAGSVTALDISPEMLRHLKMNAAIAGLDNIRYVNSSWQEAFASGDLAEHDVVVASRSLMSGDMQSVLSGVVSAAARAAYLTFPVIHLPLDWEVYRAIGRDGKKHPPYIYLLNMLYQMGIRANVEILFSKVKVQFSNFDELIEELQWRTDPFTPDEIKNIRKFLELKFADQIGQPVFTHEGKSQWALIWWRRENLE